MPARIQIDRSLLLHWVLGLAMIVLFGVPPLYAKMLPPGNPVQVEGNIEEGKNVSAVVATDRFLLVGSDERAAIQVLDRMGSGFKAGRLIPLLQGEAEADIEGMAIRQSATSDETTVYVIGCHCPNRKKLEDDKTVAKNRERLGAVETEASRAGVYRFTVDAQGALSGSVERKSLTSFLKGDSILKRFAEIPSKENGIDIEGLAVGTDGKLFAGFRGPVLRGNFVPVLVFDFDNTDGAMLRFVNLKGLGIRDMAAVKGGLLVLAGPVGEGPADFRIFFWDGADAIPGKDRQQPSVIKELGTISLPDPDAKPEGLAVLSEDDQKFDVLLVFDGIANGRPTRLTVGKAVGDVAQLGDQAQALTMPRANDPEVAMVQGDHDLGPQALGHGDHRSIRCPERKVGILLNQFGNP